MIVPQNKKGFTLFTALVSFIVIGMTILVIQHMDNSEQNYSKIILNIREQSDMESVKDFLRLESFNIFNILLRSRVYSYFSVDCNSEIETGGFDADGDPSCQDVDPSAVTIELDSGIADDKNSFESGYFMNKCTHNDGGEITCDGTNGFALFLAQHTNATLEQFKGSFKNQYQFKVYDPTILSGNPEANPFKEGLQSISDMPMASGVTESLNKRYKGGESILEFVGCSDGGGCENGSFYVLVNFDIMSDEKYFNLPRMFLWRTQNYSSLDDSILPRMLLRFYIPFRIMGAYSTVKSELKSGIKSYGWVNEEYGPTYEDEVPINDCPADSIDNTELGSVDFDPSDAISSILGDNFPETPHSLGNDFEIVDFNIKVTEDHPILKCTYPEGGPSDQVVNVPSQVRVELIVKDNSETYGFAGSEIKYPVKIIYNTDLSDSINTIEKECTIDMDSGDPLSYTCALFLSNSSRHIQ